MAADATIRHVVTFGRVLREVGIEVGPGRLVDAVTGLSAVDLRREEDVYFTLRQTLVSHREELDLFDRAFRAWFLRAPVLPPPRLRETSFAAEPARDVLGETIESSDVDETDELELGASEVERLRETDFGEMTPEELRRVKRLIADIAHRRPRRTSRRRRAHARGDILDMRRLIRRSLRTGGEVVDWPFRARKEVPRKLVVLCDVSGSMETYTRVLILFLHAAVGSGAGVEAFAFGTRLSRLTPAIRARDPEAALERCRAAVTDWGGGTRIGASLKEFNDLYGRQALSRGAVVVIVSDGWERQDPALLGREMARLAHVSYAVLWVNPLKGNPDYQPLAGGMRAALPFVDRFLAGHNLRSLEELSTVLGSIERRHAA